MALPRMPHDLACRLTCRREASRRRQLWATNWSGSWCWPRQELFCSFPAAAVMMAAAPCRCHRQSRRVQLVRVSAAPLTLAAGCKRFATDGHVVRGCGSLSLFVAINPSNPTNLIGAWQQDRWSNGGAQGLLVGASFDDGRSWTVSAIPFAHCTAGTPPMAAISSEPPDPWMAVSPGGIAYALALSFSGATLAPRFSECDARIPLGRWQASTWGQPVTLIRDGDQFFNDKGSITADVSDARFVYAVWDRLTIAQDGPTWFARTLDGGASWQTPQHLRPRTRQSDHRQPDRGTPRRPRIINVFTEIDIVAGRASAAIRAIRSTDHGDTWSAPVTVAELLAIGAADPDTGLGAGWLRYTSDGASTAAAS